MKSLSARPQTPIAVVGLGYVGLPLALEFGKVQPTIGFDVNEKRIISLKHHKDTNGEHTMAEIKAAKHITFTSDAKALKKSRFIIVAVPTPVNSSKQPDLIFVESATRTIGRNLTKGAIVVYEATVYPGVTEEFCVPILEEESGLKFQKDFWVGYSPERINPGDKEHTITKIVKVVSGCCQSSLDIIAATYARIIDAGVYKAPNIKTAEAAKVIENTQRDLNIALMNELALIFHRMGVDTREVIAAAGTKWNFHKFYPGLVGGHCIGVDPYYLTYKAEELGYHPQVILSGRRINDNMGKYIAEQTVKHLIRGGKTVKGARVMVMGITFKENVSDIRNSRVIDLIRELQEYGIDVKVCDPHADPAEVKHEYGLTLSSYDRSAKLDAVVIAVNHAAFKTMLTPATLKSHLSHGSSKGVVVDVKGILDPAAIKATGLLFWRL